MTTTTLRDLIHPSSRRRFLQSLGASAALSPFLPASLVSAATSTAPKRLIIYWTPNGVFHPEFKPDGGESDFRLRRVLQPLEKFRSKMLLLHNLDWQSFFKHPLENTHSAACMSLTGTAARPPAAGAPPDAVGPSVDQAIARRLNRPGFHDGLVTGMNTYWPHTRLYYGPDGQNVSGSNSAVEVFRKLIGQQLKPGQPDPVRDARKSVIDRVRLELRAVQARVAQQDRHRIEAHLDHIRTFEQRLDASVSLACATGAAPQKDATSPPVAGATMLNLLTLALKCDASRVASFTWLGPGGAGNIVYDWLGAPERHHDLSHGGRPLPGQPTYESLVKIGRFHAEQLANFLGALDSVAEGERTMLDNSVVLWTSEHAGNKVGAEDHERRDVPFALFGSAGGYFSTGRSIDCKGRPHNELLLSLVHSMGFTSDKTFGDPELCSGPLPGLS